jgi:hypothetical protein
MWINDQIMQDRQASFSLLPASMEVSMAAADKKCDHKPTCINEMMNRLGIELGGGILPRQSLTYATACQRCEQCQTLAACREWLKIAPEALNFAPKFCPNGDILFELQFDQLVGLRATQSNKTPDRD